MSLALLFHYLLLIMFRMLVHPSSGACDLLWIYFVCCIALVRCVLVLPTHIEPEQYNTWNKSIISRKPLKMDVLTFETCWAVNSEIIKQVTSSRSIFVRLSLTFVIATEYGVILSLTFFEKQNIRGKEKVLAWGTQRLGNIGIGA